MNRYHDDMDRSRRDDEDPDATRRRERLMQRRLRRARGAEFDDELYDDYDERDYPRRGYGYPAGSSVPRYGSGGGCIAPVLYILLGAALALGVFWLAGRQFVGNVTGNVPVQIQRIVATPTPTLVDRGGTIRQIRELNRLETQSFSVERVVEASVQRGNILDTFLGDRLLLIASGTVVAGVDMSKLRDSDVTISSDGKQIILRLPPSEIFIKTLDNQRTRVYDRQSGLLAGENKDLETQARQAAEDEILRAACEGGIMQKAADEAERSLTQFLRLLKFEQVEVIASAGPCVAPATVPTLPTVQPGPASQTPAAP